MRATQYIRPQDHLLYWFQNHHELAELYLKFTEIRRSREEKEVMSPTNPTIGDVTSVPYLT